MTEASSTDLYFLRGYTGHTPGLINRCGGSYSSLSHKLFLSPCTNHSPSIVLTNLNVAGAEKPDPKKLKLARDRARTHDVVFKYPMLAGYDGHIPGLLNQCGDRFAIEALEAMTDFTLKQELKNCEMRNLQRRDVPFSGHGQFYPTTADRIGAENALRMPLQKVTPRVRGNAKIPCNAPKKLETYTKESNPLFMECGDPRKFILAGYMGQIPLLKTHFGHTNAVVTHGALCEFLEKRRRFNYGKWCPESGLKKCPLPLAAYDDRSCPAQIDYSIYDSNYGMIPTYAGHVPGYRYTCGGRYSKISSNAMNWLEIHRGDTTDPAPARIRA